jgi:hypothetical protein
MLTREQLCLLAGMELEAFKTLRKLGRIPTMADDQKDARGYTPFEAFMLVISDDLANGLTVSRTVACEIAMGAYKEIACNDARWQEICDTSADLVSGVSPNAEILFGRIDPLGGKSKIVCGTLAEISAAHPSPVRTILTNVSRCAAVMRQRAARHKIDLVDPVHEEKSFWSA